MFTVYCSSHGGPVLLDLDSIEGLSATSSGFLIRWRCTCGQTGTEELGRPAVHPDAMDYWARARSDDMMGKAARRRLLRASRTPRREVSPNGFDPNGFDPTAWRPLRRLLRWTS
jgi:hypothetical protein